MITANPSAHIVVVVRDGVRYRLASTSRITIARKLVKQARETGDFDHTYFTSGKAAEALPLCPHAHA